MAEKVRQSMGLQWGTHFGPHDITQKHQGWEQAESRLMLARRAGWHFTVTPKMSLDDGIESLRYILPKVRIDMNGCALGVRALREYQREYDDVKACFREKPLHNWSSHPIDALRYLSINYRRLYAIPMEQHSYEYGDGGNGVQEY